MTTFKHSGKLGDVIYSLPAVRALGGGEMLLGPNQATGLTELDCEAIAPLLLAQPYIGSVDNWRGQRVDHDLDAFRRIDPASTNLAVCHLKAFGLPDCLKDVSWLSANGGHAVGSRQVIFARSARPTSVPGFWRAFHRLFGHLALFVGTSEEHSAFESEIGQVPCLPTANLLELAEVVAGCSLFVGNQSCPYAIAEGLKVKTVQETDARAPNCLFLRDGAAYFDRLMGPACCSYVNATFH